MKPKFLDKVKVKQFAHSLKTYDSLNNRNVRVVNTKPNDDPDTLFTVVGCSHINIGYSFNLGSKNENMFCTTGRKQVFIVANKLNKRFKVLPEDLEIIKESGVA